MADGSNDKGCSLCPNASHFYEGRKGSRADETKFLFVLHCQNYVVKQAALSLGDMDNWTAAWLTSPTGQNLSGAMKVAGLDLEDVLIANVLKCVFPKGSKVLAEQYMACKKKWFDSQVWDFKPKKIVLFGDGVYHRLFPKEDLRGGRFKDELVGAQVVYGGVPALVMNHPSAPYWRGHRYQIENGELIKSFLEG
jgi:uracil-DNA glycosylase family 4